MPSVWRSSKPYRFLRSLFSFEFYDESQTRARGQSESLLRHAKPLRVCRTNLPMSPGVYFIAFIAERGYRTGIF